MSVENVEVVVLNDIYISQFQFRCIEIKDYIKIGDIVCSVVSNGEVMEAFAHFQRPWASDPILVRVHSNYEFQ